MKKIKEEKNNLKLQFYAPPELTETMISVGKHAREILLGSYKERKHKVTKKENTTRDVFGENFDFFF